MDVWVAYDRHFGDNFATPNGEVEDLDAAHAGKPMPPQYHLAVNLPTPLDRGQQIITAGVALRGIAPMLRGNILVLNIEIPWIPIRHIKHDSRDKK